MGRRHHRATASDGNAVRDSNQDERGTRLGRDLLHAVRGLRRSPGFAASVALMLALGLGANTAMFGIVYGVLLRPLPRMPPQSFASGRAADPRTARCPCSRRAPSRSSSPGTRRSPIGEPGRRHLVRRPGLAVAVPAAGVETPTGAALHRGGSAGRRGPRRAAQPRHVDDFVPAYRRSRPLRKRAPSFRRAAPASWRARAGIRHPATGPRSLSA